ncbi:MAG: hypothetical protein JJT77_12225, partial [Crocinitomicaceae bacterium]|nr:hypothetical protein [Crocinitomicaceae bacterium]
MKKLNHILLHISLVFLTNFTYGQGVGINESGNPANPSAILDIESPEKGFRVPRMTTVDRGNITSPASGLMIYNLDTDCLESFDGTNWQSLCQTPLTALVTSLDCSNNQMTGQLLAIEEVTGIKVIIPYTGGNGGVYDSQQILSTGIAGYQATIDAGNVAAGNGTITLTISGTPLPPQVQTIAGTAASPLGNVNFAINLGGQNCSVNLPITCFSLSKPTALRIIMSPATGNIWMDRNLGASKMAQSADDPKAYGDLYQWGRFSDGHQCRWSGSTTTISTSDNPNTDNFIISGPSVDWDWRSPANNSLWQGVLGINNPCPSGFRLPTSAEFLAETATWPAPAGAVEAFNSPLKLS